MSQLISLFLTYSLKHPLNNPVSAPVSWMSSFPAIGGLVNVLLHQPCVVEDPFFKGHAQGDAQYVLQCFFKDLASLEDACASGSVLHGLATDMADMLGPCEVSQQIMTVRSYPVPAPSLAAPGAPTTACTYLVAYFGANQPYDRWLSEYIRHHVPLMQRLSQIRQVEVYTRVDAISELGFAHEAAIQRNKVVFDSPDALLAALQSPLRAEMRADFLSLPDIGLSHTHQPMQTDSIFNAV